MATLTTTTIAQMEQYCEGATDDTAFGGGNKKYQTALHGMMNKFSDEVRQTGNANGWKYLKVEVEGQQYEIGCYVQPYNKRERWTFEAVRSTKMSNEQAASQQARLGRMFSK